MKLFKNILFTLFIVTTLVSCTAEELDIEETEVNIESTTSKDGAIRL